MADPINFTIQITNPGPVALTIAVDAPVITSVVIELIGPAGADGTGTTPEEIVAAINAQLGSTDWQAGGSEPTYAGGFLTFTSGGGTYRIAAKKVT
jgi:hypothetical protein